VNLLVDFKDSLGEIDKKGKIFAIIWMLFTISVGIINGTFILTTLYVFFTLIMIFVLKPKSAYEIVFSLLMVSLVFDYTLHMPGISKLYFFHIIFSIFTLMSFYKVIKDKNIIKGLDKKFIILLGIFFSFVTISIFWAINKKFAIQFIIIYLMMVVFILDMLIYSINKKRVNDFFRAIITSFCFIIIVGIIETVSGSQLPVVHNFTYADYTPIQMAYCNSKPVAFSYNLNNYAGSIAILSSIVLFSVLKIKNIILKIAVSFCAMSSFGIVAITTSRTGYVGIVLVIILFYFYNLLNIKKLGKNNIIIITVMAIGFILLNNYSYLIPNIKPVYEDGKEITQEKQDVLHNKLSELSESTEELGEGGSVDVRRTIYTNIVNGIIKEKNYLGFGAGNSQEFIKSQNNTGGTYSVHSLLFEILGDFGIVGFILYGLVYLYLLGGNIYCYFKKKNYISMAIAISLLALGPASFGPSTIAYIFFYWIIFAFAAVNIQICKKNRENIR